MARPSLIPVLAALMAALALPAPVRAGAHAGSRFDDPAKIARVPIDVRNNLIYFRGTIGDSDSLWFVLDSGAGSYVVRASVANSIGLPVTGGGESRGAGGKVASGRIADVTFHLAGLTIEHVSAAAIPMDDLGARNGRVMDAILGAPLFNECVIEIDYTARMLTIRDADAAGGRPHGSEVKLDFAAGLPNLAGRVTIPGRGSFNGRFMIDTGASSALILTSQFVRDQNLLEAMPNTIETRGMGVGGMTRNRLARIDRFEFAGFTLDRPLASLRTVDTGIVATGSAIGNLGGEILSRFRVTFDYARKRMFLEPGDRLAEPFEADMTGLALRVDPAASDALNIEWIQSNSPAAEAGVQPDDLLQSVDGRAVSEIGLAGVRSLFRKPGVTYHLTTTRAGAKREISITTRRLI